MRKKLLAKKNAKTRNDEEGPTISAGALWGRDESLQRSAKEPIHDLFPVSENGCPTFGLKPNQNVERKTKNAVPLALLPLPPDIQSNILSASVAFGTAGVPLNVC